MHSSLRNSSTKSLVQESSSIRRWAMALLLTLILPVNAAFNTANAITVNVTLNGQPTTKPGPTITTGTELTWTYRAHNDGNTALHNMEILRRQKLPTLEPWETVCTLGSIEPGKSATCEISVSG